MGAAVGAAHLGAAVGAAHLGAADGAVGAVGDVFVGGVFVGGDSKIPRKREIIRNGGDAKTILAKQSRQLSNRRARGHQLIKWGLTQHGARSNWISDTLFRRCPWVVRLGDDW